MNNNCFQNISGIDVVPVVTKYLEQLLKDSDYYSSLKVPDETRYISEKVPLNKLNLLYNEFSEINSKLNHTNYRIALATMNNMIMKQGV